MAATWQPRRRYRAYVEACLTEDDGPLLEAMAASRYAMGGREKGGRRSGRLQDQDLDLPRRTAPLEEIDEAVARHYRVDARLFSSHGRSVGCAKSVAVELAAQLADLSGRAIGEHYGMCASAIGANRRRLAMRPELLQVIETLGRRLRKRSLK